MRRYFTLTKHTGETPLEALTRWRLTHPAYQDVRLSYAGRLDPMASGTLLVLVGDECKKQNRYTGLDKEYEIEVLLDISTDTGDTLGLASFADQVTHPSVTEVIAALRAVTGAHAVSYPTFSSKTVNGKPLFLHTLEGTIGSVEIPTHVEQIYRIRLLTQEMLSSEALHARIKKSLAVVPRSEEPSKRLGADFRQDEIRKQWDGLLRSEPARSFTLLRLRVTCASGTYMRTLAERIARELGTRGVAFSIHRSRIGRYLPFRGVWLRQY